jgi:hypothetical protein
MEEGRLGARSKDGTAEMQWRIKGLDSIRVNLKSLNPTEILSYQLPDFQAMRCHSCKLVIFSYVKEVEFGRP